MAIPGYVRLVEVEEELLMRRFGEEHVRYMESTGRLLPKLRTERLWVQRAD